MTWAPGNFANLYREFGFGGTAAPLAGLHA